MQRLARTLPSISLLLLCGCLIAALAGCNTEDPQHTGIYEVQNPGEAGTSIPMWASADALNYCGDRASKPEPTEGYCRNQLIGVMISPGYANLLEKRGEVVRLRGMEGRTIGAKGWVYNDLIKEMSDENLKTIREERAETTVLEEFDHLFSHIKQRLDF